MPRVEANLGEMAQMPVGVHHSWAGPSGARETSPRAESCHARYVPPKPRQRPCCKNCDGHKCVGGCRF